MTRQQLFDQIRKKQSYLCIGLDPDMEKLPTHISRDAESLFLFLKELIDATADLCVAYKPNLAFFEALGTEGWQVLERVIDYIPDDIFIIADAKRGDIGNTSGLYARAFFDKLNCDAVTVAPYMGHDSVKPFLSKPGKWVVLLALTSNPGSADFQLQKLESGRYLFEEVLLKSQEWATMEQLMFVVGATRTQHLQRVRALAPDHFLLVPGVGAQGGSLEEVSRLGMNTTCGLLVNASRSILYASSGAAFAEAARSEAGKMQREMRDCLEKYLG